MPTETKKMAPKRSFTGLISRSMRSASTVSARMEPITKAPRAAEKPAFVAISTMPRQRPTLTISSVSPLRKRFALLRKEGIRKMPTTKQKSRNSPSFTTLPSSSMPSTVWLTAMVESRTISRTAKRSSTTRMPNTTPAKCWSRRPMSSKALKMMVVDDIESMPPRKRLFICPQPRARPVA